MAGHVLVVDDSAEMCDLFQEILELDGHSVAAAPTVDAALRDAAGGDSSDRSGPQVILVDVELAGDDVPSLTARLHERWPGADVVCMVDARHADVKRRLERSRVRHFARPFQIEDLRDLVNGLVRRQTRAGR